MWLLSFSVEVASQDEKTAPEGTSPPFGCGCGKCTFFSYIESGCPTPIPSASSFPYLNLSGLTQWQQQELRGRLRSESQEIMIQFQKLVSATIKSFQERCVPLDDLVSYVMSLKAFDPVFTESKVPVFYHRFEELKAAGTITGIFMVLNNHFSFFNYHILEEIIEELGTEEDKERLKTYKEHFNKYAKRRIFECPSEFGPVSDVGYADIIVKLGVEHEKFTVAEIDLFCHKLSEIVHISSQGVLCLCRVEQGCIQLTFQVPSFVQQKIFPLSREQEMALEEEGVIKLKCGKYFLSKSAKMHGRLHMLLHRPLSKIIHRLFWHPCSLVDYARHKFMLEYFPHQMAKNVANCLLQLNMFPQFLLFKQWLFFGGLHTAFSIITYWERRETFL